MVKKGWLTLYWMILFLFFSSFAGAVGIMFSTKDVSFVPNQELTIEYAAYNTNDETMGISIFFSGDLAEYMSASPDEFQLAPHETKKFNVIIKFPEKIEKPGVHQQLISVKENRYNQHGTIVVFAQVNQPLRIHVPYSGKYLDAYLSSEGAKQGEDVKFKVSMTNLGDQAIDRINGTVYAYNGANESVGSTDVQEVIGLEPNEVKETEALLKGDGLSPGRYWAYAELDYDGISAHTPPTEFRIGELKVDLIDFSRSGFVGKINPFYLEVESNWNEPINEVVAEVSLKNGTVKLSQFRTLSESLTSWDRKNLTGYIDLSSIPIGNYTLDISLKYGNKAEAYSGSFEVKLEPKQKEKFTVPQWAVISIIVIAVLLINIGIWIIINRKERLN
ncbi:MAG: hypothetical protein QXT20_02180 [Candidatus Woesearchaeota archaeon]